VQHLGKLIEELGECTSAASRCLVQGIDATEPSTGEVNRVWLEKEMADVFANLELCIEYFGLAPSRERVEFKKAYLRKWHGEMIDTQTGYHLWP
jgi:hypothetical protein